jgi:hypothetical protein
MTQAYQCTKAWRRRHPDIRAYRAEEARKWRAAHPEKHREIKQRHRMKNLEKIRERDRTAQTVRRKANPEAQRIRMERFKAKRHAEKIAVAGRPKPAHCELCGEKSGLAVVFDHCHKTGQFRGWICDRCNRVLGLVYDNPKLLRKMAKYLETKQKSRDKTPELHFVPQQILFLEQ